MQRASLRQEFAVRIFGVDPRFDRMPTQLQIALVQGQSLTGGDPELPFDEVEPGHHLGDRVLDLQPRVHFDKIETVGIGDKLDRTGPDIADRSHRGHGCLPHCGPPLCIEPRRRGLLQHFLMATLDRAVAFEQMDRVAMAIGKNLEFDVTRLQQIFLNQHAIVAKGARCLTLGPGEYGGKLGGAGNHPHAAAAAAGNGLDQYRKPDPLGLVQQTREVLVFAVIAGNQRHAGSLHQGPCGRFGSHGPDRRRRRTDEHDPGGRAGLGEIGILR